MPVRFILPSDNVINQGQIEAIYNRMIENSPTFSNMIRDIEAAHNNNGQQVAVIIGYADEIGVKYNADTSFSDDGKTNVIRIPIEAIQGTLYEEGKFETIERVLAHEFAHVWQDAMDIPLDPSLPFNYLFNNIIRSVDAEFGTIYSALYKENSVMEDLGETPDPTYGFIPSDFGGFIHYYNENGMLSILPGSEVAQAVKVVSDTIDLIIDAFITGQLRISPLVLDLDGNQGQTTALSGTGSHPVYFDHKGDGFAEASGWVGSGDGLLAIDKNANGIIDNGTELFGNQGERRNGFEDLRAYDSNSDGKIDASDAQLNNLRATSLSHHYINSLGV